MNNQNLSFLETESKMDDCGQMYVEVNRHEQKRMSQNNHINGSHNLLTTATYQQAANKRSEQADITKHLTKSEFNIDLIQSGEDKGESP